MRNRSQKNRFISQSRAINEFFGGLFNDEELRNRSDINGIEMVPTDKYKCMVACDGKSVYANHKFYTGEIVEICPIREISKQSLYSRSVRDMAFEVAKDEYVIPLGYCQFYDILDGFNQEANCSWEWNSKKKTIIIRAIKKIERGEKLVLNIEE